MHTTVDAMQRPRPAREAVLFLAHETGAETLAALGHLRATAGADRATFLLLDTAHGAHVPTHDAARCHAFDIREFARWGLPVHGQAMLPGHCHYPVLKFAREHAAFDFVWLVEYDVRFSGHWSTVFDEFRADPADLVSCHLRSDLEEPSWYWWRSLRAPAGIDVERRWRALLVIARYSRRAFATLADAYAAGWSGHAEAVVPTALASAGLGGRDLNGFGIHLPLRANPGFYTSAEDPSGTMRWGSVRYRPAHRWFGFRRDRLYHPVKPRKVGERAPLRDALGAEARELRAAFVQRIRAPTMTRYR